MISLELHLESLSADKVAVDLPARFGAQIRAVGGRYGEARGDYAMNRTVVLPMTAAGEALAAKLLQVYPHGEGGTTVIGRDTGGADPVWQVKSHGYELARLIGHTRGIAHRATFERAEERERQAATERAERPGKLRAERDQLVFRLAAVNAELAELGE